jgi:hypothetical protein
VEHRLTPAEIEQFERDGFVVRHSVFMPDELGEIAASCEATIAALDTSGERKSAGPYTFSYDADGVVVKWEGSSDVVLGIEPLPLAADVLDWSADPRFTVPCGEMIRSEEVTLFTEKLNLKRAGAGRPDAASKIVLHQDQPYWTDYARDVDRIVTAVLHIDEATVENGCLEVVPGSHLLGAQPSLDQDAGHKEMAEGGWLQRLAPVPAPAGSVVLFGPYLVHRSGTNRSSGDRRALLFSYQPSGYPHAREGITRRWGDRQLSA